MKAPLTARKSARKSGPAKAAAAPPSAPAGLKRRLKAAPAPGAGARLPAVKGGRTAKKPQSRQAMALNKAARQAMATGELAKSEGQRTNDRDERTLYVAFKTTDLPTSTQDISALHPDIKCVRVTRQGRKHQTSIRFCFIEFASEPVCQAAQATLAQHEFRGGRLMVDRVGKFSQRQHGQKTAQRPVNPTKLFVSGLTEDLNEAKLRKLFPKSTRALVPVRSQKKGGVFGFVQFASPGEAKAAFDASQNIEVDGHHLTVLFARLDKPRRTDPPAETDGPARKKAKGASAPAESDDEAASPEDEAEEDAEADDNEDDEADEDEADEDEADEDEADEDEADDEAVENDPDSEEES